MYEHLNKEVYLHLLELSMGIDILKRQLKYNNNNNNKTVAKHESL